MPPGTRPVTIAQVKPRGVGPASGPVVVTGAAGGVGSVAIAVLAKLGYHVIASTGRMSEAAYLGELGATEIIDRVMRGREIPVRPRRATLNDVFLTLTGRPLELEAEIKGAA